MIKEVFINVYVGWNKRIFVLCLIYIGINKGEFIFLNNFYLGSISLKICDVLRYDIRFIGFVFILSVCRLLSFWSLFFYVVRLLFFLSVRLRVFGIIFF